MGLVSTLKRSKSVLPKRLAQAQSAQANSVSVADQQALQTAFIELVGERWGYQLARRMKMQEMSEKTKTESKAARELASKVSESIEELIKSPSEKLAQAITSTREKLKTARKTLKDARKPFMEKITPLTKAVKYCDNVAIPDSLKELGHPVAPRFSLSDWAKQAIEPKKKE